MDSKTSRTALETQAPAAIPSTWPKAATRARERLGSDRKFRAARAIAATAHDIVNRVTDRA